MRARNHDHLRLLRTIQLAASVILVSLLRPCTSARAAVADPTRTRTLLREDSHRERQGFLQGHSRHPSSTRLLWNGDVYHVVKPKYNATVVSGLYDIGRSNNGDGRQMSQYLEWFEKTLTYNGPMVIFVGTAEHADLVAKARHGQHTHIIVRPLDRLKYIPLRHVVKTNLNSEKFKRCRQPSGRLEYVNDAYCMLVFMKLPLLEEVATINPYHTKYFLWIDAGMSRFWNTEIAQQGSWPSLQRMLELDPMGDKIFIKRGGLDNTMGQRVDDAFEFMCGDGNGFSGALIGGTEAAIATATKDQEDFLYREMLGTGSVGNEQMFFAVWASRNSSRVVHWPPGGSLFSAEAKETDYFCWLSDRALGMLAG